MQQRYYDPDAMRFLSMDPVEADSAGGNLGRYWYASDNPYKFTIPMGGRIAFLRAAKIPSKRISPRWDARDQLQARGVILRM
jgi:hypothetical protein